MLYNFGQKFLLDFSLWLDFEDAAKAHEIIMNGSIANSLINYYQADKSNLHPFTVKRIEAGIPVPASDYISAIENAKKMKQTLKKLGAELILSLSLSVCVPLAQALPSLALFRV